MINLMDDFDRCNLVFVYGTLKSGYGNNRLLSSSTLVGTDSTIDKYVLGDIGFPYAFPESVIAHLFDDEELFKPVYGELWQMNCWNTLRSLDSLEGHPWHYYRETIQLASGNIAWTYHQLDETAITRCYICNITENGEWEWQR